MTTNRKVSKVEHEQSNLEHFVVLPNLLILLDFKTKVLSLLVSRVSPKHIVTINEHY